LKGFGDIFHVAFLAVLSSSWLSELITDKAIEDASPPKPFPLLSGNVYCKKK
jgi:hypothetical protein